MLTIALVYIILNCKCKKKSRIDGRNIIVPDNIAGLDVGRNMHVARLDIDAYAKHASYQPRFMDGRIDG